MLTELWTPENIALLGTMPDSVLARQLDVNTMIVWDERQARGVPLYGDRQRTEWSVMELGMLNHYSDEQLAKLSGRSLAEVAEQRAKRSREDNR